MNGRWFAACAVAAFLLGPVGAFAKPVCEARLTTAIVRARINREWPHLFKTRFSRRLARYAVELGLRPYRLVEAESLLDDGRLPNVNAGFRVRFVRKSRAAGIAELRRALTLGTEWSYVFVPAIGAWVSDTLEADRDFVGTSTDIRRLLQRTFGEIECFHTHPWIALTTLASFNVSTPHQRMVHLGLPSDADFESMIWLERWRPRGPGPGSASTVVHPLGLTKYSVDWRHGPDGRFNAPVIPRILHSKFVSGHYPGQSARALRQILRNAGRESERGQPDVAEPSRIRLEFEPFSE